MTKVKPQQRIISFSEHKHDLDKISQFISEGWAIVKLMPSGSYFIGIMEKIDHTISNLEDKIYIPARKRIKISY